VSRRRRMSGLGPKPVTYALSDPHWVLGIPTAATYGRLASPAERLRGLAPCPSDNQPAKAEAIRLTPAGRADGLGLGL
jgi:hypothetical protein